MTLRAFCLLRKQPHYRHDAFVAGLTAAGYKVLCDQPWWPVGPSDVLLIWNRYDVTDRIADKFEAQGGTVLVAENGYLGAAGGVPKTEVAAGVQDAHYYAIARHAHNGRGTWHQGSEDRWAKLGIELAPMKTDGRYTLVAPNRSFGMAGGIMPPDWADRVAALLRAKGEPVRVRHHPGNLRSDVSLFDDLVGARRVVIWSSSVGVHALVRGIPVECHAPWWIGKGAATAPGEPRLSAAPFEDKRLHALQRLAWAQWTVEEIAAGAPFRHLLQTRATECTA